MKHAAIASSSNMLPAAGCAALDREANTRPATAASTPMLSITPKLTHLTLTPDSAAAVRLPPRAYTWRPNTVRVVTSVYAMISTASRISTFGRPRLFASCQANAMMTAATATICTANRTIGWTSCW